MMIGSVFSKVFRCMYDIIWRCVPLLSQPMSFTGLWGVRVASQARARA